MVRSVCLEIMGQKYATVIVSAVVAKKQNVNTEAVSNKSNRAANFNKRGI